MLIALHQKINAAVPLNLADAAPLHPCATPARRLPQLAWDKWNLPSLGIKSSSAHPDHFHSWSGKLTPHVEGASSGFWLLTVFPYMVKLNAD
jgi:hypothetical protein